MRAGGLRAAFGSDGKSIQVGLAAATGVAAARLAAAGATVPHDRIAAAWTNAYGGEWDTAPGNAVEHNWIKAWPCCLQTHGAIECAERAGGAPDGPITVLAHPVSRQAAGYDAVETPLQAKFSIPYTTAFTLLHGGPRVDDFAALDPDAQALAERITVETDPALGESEFALLAGGDELARVDAARGSPLHPLSPDDLRAKVHDLAGDRFDELPASGGRAPHSALEVLDLEPRQPLAQELGHDAPVAARRVRLEAQQRGPHPRQLRGQRVELIARVRDRVLAVGGTRLVEMPGAEQSADVQRGAERAPVLVGHPVLGELERQLRLRHPRAPRLRAEAHVEHALDARRRQLRHQRVRPQRLVPDGPQRGHARGLRSRVETVRPTST